MKIVNNLIKIGLIIVLLYFIDNYDLLNKIKNIINGKINTKEDFTSLILPKDEAIKIFIDDQLPILNLGLTNKGNYMDDMGSYFRRHIFPCNPINTKGTLDNIFKLINNELDMAFVDEEILYNYINGDNLIKSQFKNNINNNQLPPINFSVLSVCYHQSFIFVTTENSGISDYEDLKTLKYNDYSISRNSRKTRNVRIGVLDKFNPDFYNLLKLLYYTDVERNIDIDLKVFEDYNKLGNALSNNEVDIIYLTTNKKNEMLFELTNILNCRYISPKINLEKYVFNDPLSFGFNNYILPPFVMTNNLANKINEALSNNNKNQNNNNNETKQIKNLTRKLKNMFSVSLDIKFGVHEADKREFKDLLLLLKRYIPVDNSIDDIFNLQTTFFKNESDMETHLDDNNNILFLPQNLTHRNNIIEDLSKYSKIDLSNSKSFISQLELKSAKTREKYKTRDSLIKNKFNIIFDKVENLSTSYNNINTVSNLHTYSTRILLVARNDIETRYIEQITENFIKNLRGLHKNINEYLSFYSKEDEDEDEDDEKEQNNNKNNKNNNKNKNNKSTKKNKEEDEPIELYNSYVDRAFNFNELVSVKDIPIHEKSKKIYEKYGLIKQISIMETDVIQDRF